MHPAKPATNVDALSDYDIELYVTNLHPFRHNDEWLDTFGPILAVCTTLDLL